jgi:hypothetical protein
MCCGVQEPYICLAFFAFPVGISTIALHFLHLREFVDSFIFLYSGLGFEIKV